MTDYLEELLDNTAALLERSRQLERALLQPDGQGGGEEAFLSAPEEERAAELPKGAGPVRLRPEETVPVQEEGTGGADAPSLEQQGEPGPSNRGRMSPEEGGRALSPLLNEVERLERAVSAPLETIPALDRQAVRGWQPAGESRESWAPVLSVPGREKGWPGAPGVPGGGQSAGEILQSPGPGHGGEQAWAEQADRAFRRDSRRYDRGFYLY